MDEYIERDLAGRESFYQQVACLSEGRVQMIDLPIEFCTRVNKLMPSQLDSFELVKATEEFG
jgi:hypothetical protein